MGCPCVACTCLIYLVRRLFLVWMPVASLLSVCWSLPPDRGGGVQMPRLVSGLAAAQAHPQSMQWEQRQFVTILDIHFLF